MFEYSKKKFSIFIKLSCGLHSVIYVYCKWFLVIFAARMWSHRFFSIFILDEKPATAGFAIKIEEIKIYWASPVIFWRVFRSLVNYIKEHCSCPEVAARAQTTVGCINDGFDGALGHGVTLDACVELQVFYVASEYLY